MPASKRLHVGVQYACLANELPQKPQVRTWARAAIDVDGKRRGQITVRFVDADDHDCVAFPGVVQESGEAWALFAGAGASQFVVVELGGAGRGECVVLLVEGLVAGGDSGVAE